MWEICRAEASLSNDYDEFCSIFLEKDVDDLAFREDLDTYWKRGYGHEIDYEIGNFLIFKCRVGGKYVSGE